MKRLSTEEFHRSEKTPLTVVLDNVRSMHNVGSVLRTADAFRIECVYMCGITSTPPHPELHKTALGAEDSVAWRYEKNTIDAIDALHGQGYSVYAVEQCEGSTMMQHIDTLVDKRGGKYAVVLGNEVHGVQQEVVDACDGCIEIPQFGTKHSLNVSVTAGIVIWEIARRLLLSVSLLLFVCLPAKSQNIDIPVDMSPMELDSLAQIMPEWHIKKRPEFYEGEWIPVIVLPEIPVYGAIHFKNSKERQKYDRLVYNIKKVLPIAKMANRMICETYTVMEQLPDEKSRKEHMSMVEKDVKRQYTPMMKKLTYSQGKLLIKLIDRECNQTSYEIVQAFLGPAKAVFYQIFAWTFRASLKKTYDPSGDDFMIERIVRQIEVGAI